MNRIAEQIKTARIKAKLSEKELAKKCGLQVSYIMQVESGKKVINEKMAEKILKVLGDQMVGLTENTEGSNETKAPQIKMKQSVSAPKVPLNPNEGWKSALSQLIKEVPIIDILTWKTVGSRSYPVMEGKVLGYNGDKLLIVKVGQVDVPNSRIMRGDEILISKVFDFHNNAIYLIQQEGKRKIAKLSHHSAEQYYVNGSVVDKRQVEIMGKCLSVQFDL